MFIVKNKTDYSRFLQAALFIKPTLMARLKFFSEVSFEGDGFFHEETINKLQSFIPFSITDQFYSKLIKCYPTSDPSWVVQWKFLSSTSKEYFDQLEIRIKEEEDIYLDKNGHAVHSYPSVHFASAFNILERAWALLKALKKDLRLIDNVSIDSTLQYYQFDGNRYLVLTKEEVVKNIRRKLKEAPLKYIDPDIHLLDFSASDAKIIINNKGLSESVRGELLLRMLTHFDQTARRIDSSILSIDGIEHTYLDYYIYRQSSDFPLI